MPNLKPVPRVRRASPIGFLAPVIAAWLVPTIAFLAYLASASRAEQASTSVRVQPTTSVTVGSRSLTVRQAVEVVVEFPSAAHVFAPAGGMLTAVGVAPGDRLATGSYLGAIEGVSVYASADKTPVFRDVAAGQTGPDIEGIAALLVSLGHLSATDAGNTVTPAMVAGIKRFQRSVGETPDGVFRARHAAHIPIDGTVKRFIPEIGGQVPPGSPLIELQQRPSSLSFRPAGAGPSLERFEGVPLTLSVGPHSFDISSVTPAADEAEALYGFLQRSAPTAVDDTASQASRPTAKFTGLLLSWRTPKSVATVPAPAVLTIGTDRHCLLEVRPDGIVALPLAQVEPLTGELGVVAVAADLVGRTVLADASRASEEVKRLCG